MVVAGQAMSSAAVSQRDLCLCVEALSEELGTDLEAEQTGNSARLKSSEGLMSASGYLQVSTESCEMGYQQSLSG